METLLTTKLYIPQVRPHLLPRPHLFERLQQGLWGRLTLVSAPPGFGKTTLVSSWAAQCGRPVAWLSLDEHDNTPARFLSYLVAALQTLQPNIGRSLAAILDAPTLPSVQRMLPPLINDLAALTGELLFVLDDYHLIQNDTIHEIVTFLIDHMPPSMHLILTSRADPPLPLARWRARGQLTEMRTNDLRFSPTETTHLFEQASHHHLSSAETLALEEQLEGWIAGLQMALLSLRGRQTVAADTPPILTGRHPYILDYLADEVLHQQPESIQHFLLQTSILDRLSGPLCDAVLERGTRASGQGDELSTPPASRSGQAILEYLEQANLFIVPLDDRRHWYRYHHLFADFLRNQLQKQTATDSRWPTPETLHRRAAAWYEQQGPRFNALEHALAAGDLDWAARLVERQGELHLMRRTFSTLRDWLERLPTTVIRSRPRLAVLNFWLLLFSGDLQQAEPYLPLAEAQAHQDDLAVEGRVAAAQAFLLAIRKEPGRAIERCQHTLAKIPASEAIVRGQLTLQLGIAHEFNEDLLAADQVYQEAQQTYQRLALLPMEVWVNSRLGWVQFLRGQLRQAETTYRHTLQTVAESEKTVITVTGWTHIGLGRLLYERNNLTEAERHLTLGIEWSQQELDRGMALIGYVYLAWIRYAQGDVEAAHHYFAQVNDWTENNRATRSDGFIAAHQMRLRLRLDDLATVPAWLEHYRAGQTDPRSAPLAYTHLRELEDLTLAQVYLAQDQPDQALPILTRCLAEAQAAQRHSSVIEILLWQALTRHALGETDEALSILETALRLAAAAGYVRTVLDVGLPLAALLPQIGPESGGKPYAVKLLELFDVTESALPPSADPLTDREVEVLHLLANGHSNREIAEQLVISIGTVAKHTHNIFTKLEADNRAHAVTRAQRLGLI